MNEFLRLKETLNLLVLFKILSIDDDRLLLKYKFKNNYLMK